MTKLPTFLCLTGLLVPLSAFAETGTVEFHGRVIALSCEMMLKQISVPMETVNAQTFKDGGKSVPKAFSISLGTCIHGALSPLSFSFDGSRDAVGPEQALFPLDAGGVKGLGLEIARVETGAAVIPGQPFEMSNHPEEREFHFQARYVPLDYHGDVGAADASVTFTITPH